MPFWLFDGDRFSPTLLDRVAETTTTTGTGAYLLNGVLSAGYRPFGDAGDGALVLYCCTNGSVGKSEWGLGTYRSATNTLERTTIIKNHLNTTAAIDWEAGTKNIFSCDIKKLWDWITYNHSLNVEGLTLAESGGMATPASGFGAMYVLLDGHLYFKNDAGTEFDLTLGSTLDSLTDVVITSAANNELLQFNGTNWVNRSISAAGIQPLDATLTAFAALTIAANTLTIGTGADAFSQTSFAANTFPARASTGSLEAKTITDFGLSLVDDADASAARTTLGLVIGTNVQAYDGTLAAFAALTIAANSLTIGTGSDAFSQTSFAANTFPARASTGDLVAKSITDFGLSLVDDADASAARTTLGLVIGTNVQAYHARLADIAGSSWAQGDVMYFDGSNLVRLAAGTNGYFLKTQGAGANPVWANIPGGGDLLSTNNLSDVANAATARTNLGLAIGTNVQAYDADLATLATVFTTASASGPASLQFHEDTDNGTHKITLQAPASVAADATVTLPGTADTLVGRDTTDTLTNKTLTSPTINGSTLGGSHQLTGRSYSDLDTLTDGATITVDWSTGNTFTVTLGGNRTIAFSNTVDGQLIKIRFLQDGTGSRTLTWPGGISWAGGSAPTLTTTANKADWIGFIRTASGAYDGFVLSKNH